MSENGGSLNKNLLRKLECSVCGATCVPPIYMCSNGHTACAKCQPKLKRCGTCNDPGRPTTRNIPLERVAEIVEMTCPNQTRGCSLSFNKTDMVAHLPQCKHGFECLVCKEWRGPAIDLKRHVVKVHEAHLVYLPTSGVKTVASGFDRNLNNDLLVSFGDLLYWLNLQPTLTDRVISCTMRLVCEDPEEAAKFSFSLQFPSRSGKLMVSSQGQVLNLTEDASKDQSDFMIPATILDSYEDKIVFTLSISSKLKPTAGRFRILWLVVNFFVVVGFLLYQFAFQESKYSDREVKEVSTEQYWFVLVFSVMMGIEYIWSKLNSHSFGWFSALCALTFCVSAAIIWDQRNQMNLLLLETKVEETDGIEKFQKLFWSYYEKAVG